MKLEQRLFFGKQVAWLLLLLLVSAMISRNYAQHHKLLRKNYVVLLTDETEEDDEEDQDIISILSPENFIREFNSVIVGSDSRKISDWKNNSFVRELWKQYCQLKIGGEFA